MLKVVKWNYSPDRRGYYICSDSFFTIKSSITLLKFTAENQDNEVNLKWKTEPGLDVLSGYNLYRVKENGVLERVNDSLLKVNEFEDIKRADVTGYKLGAVNGLGEEYRIGEVEYFKLKEPVEITPSIIRHTINVSFVVPENYLISGKRQVNIFVVNTEGRVVKRVFIGLMEGGIHEIKAHDVHLSSGYYFLMVKIDKSTIYRGAFQVFGE